VENVHNDVDITFIKWDGYVSYDRGNTIAKPNFHSRSVFTENLIAIEHTLHKLEVKFNKLIYIIKKIKR